MRRLSLPTIDTSSVARGIFSTLIVVPMFLLLIAVVVAMIALMVAVIFGPLIMLGTGIRGLAEPGMKAHLEGMNISPLALTVSGGVLSVIWAVLLVLSHTKRQRERSYEQVDQGNGNY